MKPCGLACSRPSTGKLENHHKDIKFPLICSSDTLYVQIVSQCHLKIPDLQKIYLAVKLLNYTFAGSSVFYFTLYMFVYTGKQKLYATELEKSQYMNANNRASRNTHPTERENKP